MVIQLHFRLSLNSSVPHSFILALTLEPLTSFKIFASPLNPLIPETSFQCWALPPIHTPTSLVSEPIPGSLHKANSLKPPTHWGGRCGRHVEFLSLSEATAARRSSYRAAASGQWSCSVPRLCVAFIFRKLYLVSLCSSRCCPEITANCLHVYKELVK